MRLCLGSLGGSMESMKWTLVAMLLLSNATLGEHIRGHRTDLAADPAGPEDAGIVVVQDKSTQLAPTPLENDDTDLSKSTEQAATADTNLSAWTQQTVDTNSTLTDDGDLLNWTKFKPLLEHVGDGKPGGSIRDSQEAYNKAMAAEGIRFRSAQQFMDAVYENLEFKYSQMTKSQNDRISEIRKNIAKTEQEIKRLKKENVELQWPDPTQEAEEVKPVAKTVREEVTKLRAQTLELENDVNLLRYRLSQRPGMQKLAAMVLSGQEKKQAWKDLPFKSKRRIWQALPKAILDLVTAHRLSGLSQRPQVLRQPPTKVEGWYGPFYDAQLGEHVDVNPGPYRTWAEAKAAADANHQAGGVTREGPNRYFLRQGDDPRPSLTGEISWVKQDADESQPLPEEDSQGSDPDQAAPKGPAAPVLPPPPPDRESCEEEQRNPLRAGYEDQFRGFYDTKGTGVCSDFCRWVGNSGSGGLPLVTVKQSSWWSCISVKGTCQDTPPGYFKGFSFAKCGKAPRGLPAFPAAEVYGVLAAQVLKSPVDGSSPFQQVSEGGDITHVSPGNGWAWALSKGGWPWKCMLPCTGRWQKVTGRFVQIDAGLDFVFAVDKLNTVHRQLVGGESTWSPIQGSLQRLAVGMGSVWGIQTGGFSLKICSLPCTQGEWRPVNGNLVEISAGLSEVWGVKENKHVYRTDIGGAGLWRRVPGDMSHVTLGDGWAWGTDTEGNAKKCKLPCVEGAWQEAFATLLSIDAAWVRPGESLARIIPGVAAPPAPPGPALERPSMPTKNRPSKPPGPLA